MSKRSPGLGWIGKRDLVPGLKFALLSLLLLVAIVYANSLNGAWQFDDEPNIVNNASVHLRSLDRESIIRTFYGFEQKKIYRPVAYLSFGLNHYLGGLDPFGFHVVNLAIHFLAAAFLFLFVYRTLTLPRLEQTYGRDAYAIALLTAFLWAVNPLQVTAVTYIVQRMASMAGLFYILSLYLYLLGRTSTARGRKILFFSLCALSAALAVGTKENAVMIPVSLYLYDLILIQDITRKIFVKHLKYLILPAAILVSLWLLFSFDILSLASSYSERPFTLAERLLTEPRVILFYISLLLYPTYSRLMLNHDFEISRSLLEPWTTLPAILTIAICIGWAVWVARRKPLPAYCILFFFLNHLIEGSFIPLELIYEHRNYIPSMLLFLPVAICIIRALGYFSYKKILQFSIVALVTFVLIAQGHTVTMYNFIFRAPYLLWSDNIAKAPNLSRPHVNLGNILMDQGLYEEAYASYQKAWSHQRFDRLSQAPSAIYNMGRYHFCKKDYPKALAHFETAVKMEPRYSNMWVSLAQTQIQLGDLKAAESATRKALRRGPENVRLNAMLSFVLLKQGANADAIRYGWKTLAIDPEYSDVMRVLAEAYRRTGRIDRAVYLWERYLRDYREDIEGHLALIELYAETGQTDKLDRTIARVMMLKGPKSWRGLIADYGKDAAAHAYTPDSQRLLSIILNRLKLQQ
jgi:tetratricopeptide (TPR) repeat protein